MSDKIFVLTIVLKEADKNNYQKTTDIIKNFLLYFLFFDNYSCQLLLIQMLKQKFFHSLDNNRFNLIYMFNFS